ncbi:hypothetical protein [Burkholderia gladioli]|uniref:hypothetical protein n=1 Tax=Burkholderia gladioli TaxID=28095 RepID=UPI00163FB774
MHILAARHIRSHRQRLEPFDTPSAEHHARAPSAASRRAAASPAPLLAPVTTKTLFSI